jgi:enoyl-CoA hydratase/carnithine racemase
MRLETLLLDVDGPVATITLHRPDRLNAWTPRMANELFSTIAALDDDDAVRAIVITGSGRAFCAGADLSATGDTFAEPGRFMATNELEARVQPWNMSKPILAAINGPAVGIGATLPLQWDLRIASDKAKIGFVFTRRGIVPEANSTWLLPRLVGASKAMELLLMGRVIDANEALAIGLVSKVVPHDELLPTVRAMAIEIAEHTAPASIALTKRLVWRGLTEDDPARAKSREHDVFRWVGKQHDAAEGVKAFLEKRAAKWTLRPSRDLGEPYARIRDTRDVRDDE